MSGYSSDSRLDTTSWSPPGRSATTVSCTQQHSAHPAAAAPSSFSSSQGHRQVNVKQQGGRSGRAANSKQVSSSSPAPPPGAGPNAPLQAATAGAAAAAAAANAAGGEGPGRVGRRKATGGALQAARQACHTHQRDRHGQHSIAFVVNVLSNEVHPACDQGKTHAAERQPSGGWVDDQAPPLHRGLASQSPAASPWCRSHHLPSITTQRALDRHTWRSCEHRRRGPKFLGEGRIQLLIPLLSCLGACTQARCSANPSRRPWHRTTLAPSP